MEPKQPKRILKIIKDGRFILLDFKIALQLLKQCGTRIKIYIKPMAYNKKTKAKPMNVKRNFVNCSKIMKWERINNLFSKRH